MFQFSVVFRKGSRDSTHIKIPLKLGNVPIKSPLTGKSSCVEATTISGNINGEFINVPHKMANGNSVIAFISS